MNKKLTTAVAALVVSCSIGYGSAHANVAAPTMAPDGVNPAATASPMPSPLALDGANGYNTDRHHMFNRDGYNDGNNAFTRGVNDMGRDMRQGVRETGHYTAKTVRATADTAARTNWSWLGLLGLIGLAGLAGRNNRNEAR